MVTSGPPRSPSSTYHNSVASSCLQNQTPSDESSPKHKPSSESELPETSGTFPSPSRSLKRSRSVLDAEENELHHRTSSMLKSMVPESKSQWEPSGRRPRRGSLFDGLASVRNNSRIGELSSFSFLQRNSSTTTSSQEQASNLPHEKNNQSKKPQGSLFGAVMKQFGSPKKATKPSPSTPGRQQQSVNDSFRSPSRGGSGLTSPSGKSIMNIVNKFVMNSPFRFQSPKAKRRLDVTNRNQSADDSTFLSPSQKRRHLLSDNGPEESNGSHLEQTVTKDEQWHEAPIADGSMEILDWSLKLGIRMECHPSNSIQEIEHSPKFLKCLDYWEYRPRPTTSIVSNACKQTSLKEASRVMPSKEKSDGSGLKRQGSVSSLPGEKVKGLAGNDINESTVISDTAKRLVNSVRGPDAYLTRKKQTALVEQPPHREWQDAFRSLFTNWIQRLSSISDASDARRHVLQHYFYCVGEDHTVLFRIDTIEKAPYFIPRVLISSCGREFLEKLQSLGLEHWYECSPEKGGEQGAHSPRSRKQPPMSPSVKADLEALRIAQAYGQTAGADITIKSKRATATSSTEHMVCGASSVAGYDDVLLFFEVYMNLCGGVHEKFLSLPVLLCRDVGPFQYARMSSLSVYPLKQDSSNEDSGKTVEISGRILPCAFRQMAGHISRASKVKGWANATPGTNYVVFHTLPIESSAWKFPIIDSRCFNKSEHDTFLNQSTSKIFHGCKYGFGIQLVVWDKSNRDSVACRMERIVTDKAKKLST